MSLPQTNLFHGLNFQNHNVRSSVTVSSTPTVVCSNHILDPTGRKPLMGLRINALERWKKLKPLAAGVPVQPPLDLTEDNVREVLDEAREELGQIFDTSVGITGKAELAELDGPFVKISLKGRFWHKRSTVLARIANYLKQRIPEILEVDIEDQKQLDDSPENF